LWMDGVRTGQPCRYRRAALLIEGAPGSGKSSLALALIDPRRRYSWVMTGPARSPGRSPIARPHPNTRGC
jgi:hypothetical protein